MSMLVAVDVAKLDHTVVSLSQSFIISGVVISRLRHGLGIIYFKQENSAVVRRPRDAAMYFDQSA